MGKEITHFSFTDDDYLQFHKQMQLEMDYLKEQFQKQQFSNHHGTCGFELEAWLVDAEHNPSPSNLTFLKELNNPLVEDELARFNIEINAPAFPFTGDILSSMSQYLSQTLSESRQAAQKNNTDIVLAGILPTVADEHLITSNMSDKKRYRAINDQIMSHRKGHPISIHIEGKDQLLIDKHDVMLEAATTSLQLQYQVSFTDSARYYNASLIISAAMVAISANSPFIFGKDLWAESRIPLFEQSVALFDTDASRKKRRVSFGDQYIETTLFDLFYENQIEYDVLLPISYDSPVSEMNHLRLHNGTVWRWNRPLIGFDENNNAHLRIEHRVLPSGPSEVDSIANAAFYFGLLEYYANDNNFWDDPISFDDCRNNFYSAAKHGLNAKIKWQDNNIGLVSDLILDLFLNHAHTGLKRMNINIHDIEYYLGIIKERAKSRQNGTEWQRNYFYKHSCSMQQLCEAYLKNQLTQKAIHEWPL